MADPSKLCATGTVGAAALGFAFGSRPMPIDATPTSSNKRRVLSRARVSDVNVLPSEYSTPLKPSQSSSAPTTRLSKPNVLRRPLSSTFAPRNRFNSADADAPEDPFGSQTSRRFSTSTPSTERKGNQGFDIENKDALATIAKSSFLRRMSTLTTSRNGSPVSTPRPGTPTASFSNASSAPMLPRNAISPVVSRNKLVKRASSQRALPKSDMVNMSASKGQTQAMRRPATSHQRSATLMRQYVQDEVEGNRTFDPAEAPFDEIQEEEEKAHDQTDYAEDKWRPFFQSSTIAIARGSPSARASAMGRIDRAEYVRRIKPPVHDLPILLVATSVTAGSEPMIRGLSTPVSSGTHSEPNYSSQSSRSTPMKNEARSNMLDNSRNSFSISDLFPSPSPSTWKLSRPGSLRNKKRLARTPSGWRIVSAPQVLKETWPPDSAVSGAAAKLYGSNNAVGNDPSPLYVDTIPRDARSRAPSSPLPSLKRISSFDIDLSSAGLLSALPASLPIIPRPVSSEHSRPRNTSHRSSTAPSDRASTAAESDDESGRLFSVRGEEIDYQSDTIYDSVRTGITNSSYSATREPLIETLFDKSPPDLPHINGSVPQIKQPKGIHTSPVAREDVIAEEEESVHTPVKWTARDEKQVSTPPIGAAPISPVSPLFLAADRHPGSHRDLSRFEEDWSTDDDELIPDRDDLSLISSPAASVTQEQQSSHHFGENTDRPISNIFDWSERPPVEAEVQKGSSPRPKTVHGKHVSERSGRATGRRGPSAIHLRSQSVPLAPENFSHRILNNSSKIDSWLLGNKGVSEEWDGDFEFEEPARALAPVPSDDEAANSKHSSGMLVPKAILETQASVRGQFGHVKELTLLVEELKRLRHQANIYGLVQGQSAELWKEADGIVNLATLDDEEQGLDFPSSPHSTSFDFDAFEEESPMARLYRRTGFSPPKEDVSGQQNRTSVDQMSPRSSPMGPQPLGRPRKESTAQAKVVLENIHQQRNHLDPLLFDANTPQKKLPFDTTSLRDLVTRAGVVTRALKEIVRTVESNTSTPERGPETPPDPPFSHIFHPRSTSPPEARQLHPQRHE